jgi:hypothetical protein
MTEPEQWEWVRLGDEEGRIDRLSAVPAWSAPAGVELDGQSLLFYYPVRTRAHGSRALQFRRIRAGASLLTEFLKLDRAPAERILAYARQHGPLGFCQHGDPSHCLLPRGCSPEICTIATGRPAVREDIQWWRSLAGHARALLNLAAQLSKTRVNDLALAQLNPELLFSAVRLRAARRDPAPFVVYGVELWLRYFQVRPRTTYNSRGKRIEVKISGFPPLPGALAMQIMLVVAGSRGIAICSGCGGLFSPPRRPNPNRNAYCGRCGVRAAWREAQTRHRERNKTNRKSRTTAPI